MANYVIKWRTNYFRVKNIEEFEQAITPISCDIIKKRDENGDISTICLVDDGDGETDYYTFSQVNLISLTGLMLPQNI